MTMENGSSGGQVALWSTRAIQPEASAWITDVCVPLSEMAACIGLAKADINQSSLVATLVGHVGDGNFHTFMLFDPNSPEQLAEARALNRRLVQYAIAHDGTCTGEHGVGMGKLKYLGTWNLYCRSYVQTAGHDTCAVGW